MDSWEKFNETVLPPKKDFYSNITLEDISVEDYAHAQKVWGGFKKGEYHGLYVQSDTLLLADFFLKILEICVVIYMNLILYILYLRLD